MKERVIIYADEGKILTNGNEYGTQIFLADTDAKENYWEITEEEYRAVLIERGELEEQVEPTEE